MGSYESNNKKTAIAVETWDYLLKTGLMDASIGELCKEKKLSQSSIYYWFANKEELWIAAGEYGISKVVDYLFSYTLSLTENIREYFDTLLSEVEKYKYELRLAIQITSSPMFGKRMREKSKGFRLLYENFSQKLIARFGCTYEQAEIFVYTIICCVIDYALWDDGDKTQMLLDNLYNRTIRALDK